MNDPIDHLPGIEPIRVRTRRLETQVLTSGPATGEPVLFLHGNLSAATFWEETMLALPRQFRVVAPDQRGYGLSDPQARIDATRGVADWADDALALLDHFGWRSCHLVGHSLGGCVAWSLLGQQPNRLSSVTLVATGPPCGFPGAQGLVGKLNHDDGAGSGAGLTHPSFVERVTAGEREISNPWFSPRAVMNRAFWKPPFRPAREEVLLTAMLQIHTGDGHFPGDWVTSPHWPGFAPGRFGPINALSPRYNQDLLQRALSAEVKSPLLWIHGASDAIICDTSPSDPGVQGQLGLRPGWPGEEVFPPQSLLSQVSHALDRYTAAGGKTSRLVLPGVGHTPYLECPTEVQAALIEHLQAHPCAPISDRNQ